MSSGFIAGIFRLTMFVVNQAGYALGQSATPNSPTTNTLYTPYTTTAIDNIAELAAAIEQAVERGGQKIRGQRNLGIAEIGQLVWQHTTYDLIQNALISGSLLQTSYNSGITIGAPDNLNPNPPEIGVMATVGFQSRSSGSYGANEYLHYLMPRGTVTVTHPGGSQAAGTNPNLITYTGVPTITDRLHNGILLDDSMLNLSLTDDRGYIFDMPHQYQLFTETWVADGAATAFTLTYKPLFSDATATGRNWITLNGQNRAVSSVSTSTGAVSIVSPGAGASGDIWSVTYPTNFIPTA